MPQLKIHPTRDNGRIVNVAQRRLDICGLRRRLAGEAAEGGEKGREVCLVFIGNRAASPRAGRILACWASATLPSEQPWSVYIPAGMAWKVVAENGVTLAVCTAPGEGKLPARVIGPDKLHQETREKRQHAARHQHHPRMRPAELLVVEYHARRLHRLPAAQA